MIYRSFANRKLFHCLVGISIALFLGAAISEKLSAGREPASGDSHVQVSAGEAAVPSQFVGDVRNLPQAITPEERKLFHPPLELEVEVPRHKKPLPGAEAEPQSLVPLPGPLVPMPTPAITFDAMTFNVNGAGHPPDTVGDVGPNHFVQAVNTSVGIYDKSTGAAISTFTFNSLWLGAGTGTPCDTSHGGDPTVVYDPQYDRFIVADFSWLDTINGPYYECIAVSKTSNPVTGGWWLYGIRADDAAHPWLPDYPKMGIWPDGLYMSANMFDCLTAGCVSATYKEARAYAFNLNDLVTGAVLRSVVVDTTSARFTLLPSNYRGAPPPAGRPNYFVQESSTMFAWEVFKFVPNYNAPASSTFTGPTSVSQASYTVAAGTVPEPAPGNNSDTLADRAMMQNQYRNISGVESLWVNHTTGTALASTPTGIQWAQINVTGATIATTPLQQQIYNNGADGLNRFMGALALDRQGNMAVGYTASSSTVAPDIRYAGRLFADPSNTLPQSELTILPGVTRSVQAGDCSGPCTRWGDYSAMTVDPVDDCTFWYTHMYFPVQGLNWVTRIGSFKFPGCAVVVNTLDDHTDGSCNAADCTLREAIALANTRSNSLIGFTPGLTGTIDLASALPSLTSSLAIQGPGANLLTVRRNAGGNYRIFNISSAGLYVTLSGLTISNGNASGQSGGAILNPGKLTISNAALTGNLALNGGAIFNNFGTLSISNSTISGNTVSNATSAGSGGGIFNSGGVVTITNSTISGNTAIGPGGNSDSGGGMITNVGTVTLTNTTISGNSGDLGGGFRNVNGGVVHSANTIIALNTSPSGPDINGVFVSDGHNLIGDGAAGSGFTNGVNGDQVGLDPLLGPLQDNGGPTETMELLDTSPAIDAGDNVRAPLRDQRGSYRAGVSDIGAFEVQPAIACTLAEDFDDIISLSLSGWLRTNHSQPLGAVGWFQGDTSRFPSHSGPANSYIAADYHDTGSLGTISNWLLTPPVTLQDGAKLSFWTRTVDSPFFPDRLQVRMSTNGNSSDVGSSATDVGDFTTLLLDINPAYTTSGYPNGWTQYTLTISGLGSPVTGQLAFRYFVENAGFSGTNSDYIGLDLVQFSCKGVIPTPTPTPSPTATPTPTPAPTPIRLVVISQVYGGGGNTGASFQNDFIEVFNRDNTNVDISNWSVQYASAAGTTWSVTPLCPSGPCTIVPGGYFLVQQASAGAVGAVLPMPDVIGTVNLSSTTGKVALVSNLTPLSGSGCPFAAGIVDFVGYGTTANCFEGASFAPAPSNTTADLRAGGGCIDTDNNASNFSTGAPIPRNSSSPVNLCATPTPTPTVTPIPINISGSISYCSNPAPGPVPNAILTLTGSAVGSTLSDGSGNYLFSSLASGGTYTITPTKTALASGSAGINTIDVLGVQRHFLNITPLPAGCRLMAADVNADTNVTTIDVIAIQRFFLGFPTGTANVGKYKFSPVNRAYPGVVTNQTGQNYDTLIFGDVASPFAD